MSRKEMIGLAVHNRTQIVKAAGALGVVAVVFSALATLLGGCLVWKLSRFLSSAQRTMPVVEKAARVYLEKAEAERDGQTEDSER